MVWFGFCLVWRDAEGRESTERTGQDLGLSHGDGLLWEGEDGSMGKGDWGGKKAGRYVRQEEDGGVNFKC